MFRLQSGKYSKIGCHLPKGEKITYFVLCALIEMPSLIEETSKKFTLLTEIRSNRNSAKKENPELYNFFFFFCMNLKAKLTALCVILLKNILQRIFISLSIKSLVSLDENFFQFLERKEKKTSLKFVNPKVN